MEQSEVKTKLIQAWEDWDEDASKTVPAEAPKLCKIENPDCESCQ